MSFFIRNFFSSVKKETSGVQANETDKKGTYESGGWSGQKIGD
jgi:hypothetical protein